MLAAVTAQASTRRSESASDAKFTYERHLNKYQQRYNNRTQFTGSAEHKKAMIV
jgi:hypothetical protein